MLWRELQAERQVTADLRTQPEKITLVTQEAQCPAVPAVTAAPADCPAPAPANPALEAAAARATEVAQRQNALADDAEFQKARLANARNIMMSRYPGLALDLGLSAKEADTLFTILAGSQLRMDSELTGRRASGALSESDFAAEVMRLQREQAQQQKDSIVAQLGATRYAGFQEYEETRPARQRVSNFTGMLQQRGLPLSAEQSKALTALMISEQRRNESLATAAPTNSAVVRAEREIESDRRIVAAAAHFLSSQQNSLIEAKFEELAEGKRASSVMQERLADRP